MRACPHAFATAERTPINLPLFPVSRALDACSTGRIGRLSRRGGGSGALFLLHDGALTPPYAGGKEGGLSMVRYSTTTASRCSVFVAALMFSLFLAGVAAAQTNTSLGAGALQNNTTG